MKSTRYLQITGTPPATEARARALAEQAQHYRALTADELERRRAATAQAQAEHDRAAAASDKAMNQLRAAEERAQSLRAELPQLIKAQGELTADARERLATGDADVEANRSLRAAVMVVVEDAKAAVVTAAANEKAAEHELVLADIAAAWVAEHVEAFKARKRYQAVWAPVVAAQARTRRTIQAMGDYNTGFIPPRTADVLAIMSATDSDLAEPPPPNPADYSEFVVTSAFRDKTNLSEGEAAKYRDEILPVGARVRLPTAIAAQELRGVVVPAAEYDAARAEVAPVDSSSAETEWFNAEKQRLQADREAAREAFRRAMQVTD